MREKIFLLLLLLLLLGGVFWKIVPAVLSPIASDKLPDRLVEENGLLPEEQAPEFEPEMITVHLVGAVQNRDLSPSGRLWVYELWKPAAVLLKRPILTPLIWPAPFTTASRWLSTAPARQRPILHRQRKK